jgi:hypothetical protein
MSTAGGSAETDNLTEGIDMNDAAPNILLYALFFPSQANVNPIN